ncbi:MAG TPA: hypothetical protein ENN61_03145 [Bacteroidaceae bacterium]|nr:hypothetical protein [Bacteroidaceae bacterium]
MKEIEQEVLNHIPDPLAKLVWEKWIAEGKARLILPNGGADLIYLGDEDPGNQESISRECQEGGEPETMRAIRIIPRSIGTG